ncbi:hypothetical protein [Janibacter melonis]|uniref:hypothetical protein n=1 Tax=Janibacter melonis TaxID=262209 RepID=UPI00209580FC|nr:hypothetical protein [Janibacter melonis]
MRAWLGDRCAVTADPPSRSARAGGGLGRASRDRRRHRLGHRAAHPHVRGHGHPGRGPLRPRWRADAARWLQLHLDDAGVAVVVADVGGAVVSCAMGQVVDLMPSPRAPETSAGC